MKEFEEKHPDIAAKYFDLRYEDLSKDLTDYGIGRRYYTKLHCKDCQFRHIDWDQIINDPPRFYSKYFSKQIDANCLNSPNCYCKLNIKDCYLKIFELIMNADYNDILKQLKNESLEEESDRLNPHNLSFNTILDCLEILNYGPINAIGIMNKSGLNEKRVKTAIVTMCQLDLAASSSGVNSIKTLISITELGKMVLQSDKRDYLIALLSIRIPHVQSVMMDNSFENAHSVYITQVANVLMGK